MQDDLPADQREGETGVPQAVFRLDSVPARERFDLWRDSISCVFEVEATKEARASAFQAEIDANMFGQIMLARTRTLEQEWARTPRLMARDGMDHYMIQLYEHGDMTWDTPTGPRSFPKDGLVVFDLSRGMTSKTNNFSNVSLFIPRIMLEEHLDTGVDQHMRMLSSEEPMVQLLRDHMSSLKRLSSRMTARQGVEVAPATAGLAAACLNAAVSEDDPRQRAGVSMARIAVVRRFVEQHLSDPQLSATWLAGKVGMSRTKLYEQFELYGGVTKYIRDRRLRQALISLTDPRHSRRSVYEIAIAAGYSGDATFIRAFRVRYGVTPNEVRQRGAFESTRRQGDPGVDRRHEDWVRHLAV